LSVAGPVDITKHMFYTASADDETDVSSCKMEDCHHLVGVTEDSRMKLDWKSRNDYIWPWNYNKSCLNMNALGVQIFSLCWSVNYLGLWMQQIFRHVNIVKILLKWKNNLNKKFDFLFFKSWFFQTCFSCLTNEIGLCYSNEWARCHIALDT